MTSDLACVLDAYRRGLEEQVGLLERLASCATAQHDACQRRDADALVEASADRQRVLDALLSLERTQRPLRDRLAGSLPALTPLSGFDTVSRLHRRAEAWIGEVDAHDRETRGHLEQADLVRRASATTLETAEATLAAYRKILSINTPSSILDSRG